MVLRPLQWLLWVPIALTLGCNDSGSKELKTWAESGLEAVGEQASGLQEILASRSDDTDSGSGADSDSAPSFYKYTDDSGSVHFVSSLHEIPARHRAAAKPAGGGSVTRTASAGTKPKAYTYQPGPGHRASGDVVVYTAPWCGWCRKTTAWLDAKQISYDEKDIESSDRYKQELVEKTGRASIPYVEIGDGHVSGYSPERMTQLLRDS